MGSASPRPRPRTTSAPIPDDDEYQPPLLFIDCFGSFVGPMLTMIWFRSTPWPAMALELVGDAGFDIGISFGLLGMTTPIPLFRRVVPQSRPNLINCASIHFANALRCGSPRLPAQGIAEQPLQEACDQSW